MIVGAGGYIGRHLVKQCEASGVDVVQVSSRDNSGMNPETGLFSDHFTVPHGVDTIFYLAQSPRHRQMPDMASHLLSVNVISAIQIANAARRAQVRRLIYASTGNVYAPSYLPLRENAPLRRDNWYSLSKVHAEEALALFRNDMDLTIVRLFGVYGPGQEDRLLPNLLRAIMDEKEIQLNPRLDGQEDSDGLHISLCHIADTIRILLQVAAMEGLACVNVASNEVLNIRGIATLMAQALGVAARFARGTSGRDSNLIADISLLERIISPHFVSFKEGLTNMLYAYLSGREHANGESGVSGHTRAL